MVYSDRMDKVELVKRRKSIDATRAELAREIGVPWVTVWRWEEGRTIPTRIYGQLIEEALQRLERRKADALGVPAQLVVLPAAPGRDGDG